MRIAHAIFAAAVGAGLAAGGTVIAAGAAGGLAARGGAAALSGTAAGNTALCTVGRTGNDLHYRGYDILDFADKAEFEEVAYLLVHEKLPSKAGAIELCNL